MASKLEIPIVVTEDTKGITSSIAAVEKLEDRVKALTTDTVSLRKQKEAVTAELRAFDAELARGTQLTRDQARQMEALVLREKELANNLRISETALRTNRQELRNLNFAANDAARDAQLLASQFGVQLPRGLDQLVSRLPSVQKGIGAAFNAGVVVAFGVAGGQALAHIIVAATQFSAHGVWNQIKQTLTDAFSPIDTARRELIRANQEAASNTRTDRRAELQKGSDRFDRQAALVGLREEERLRREFEFEIEDIRKSPAGQDAKLADDVEKQIAARRRLLERQIAEERRKAAEEARKEAEKQREEFARGLSQERAARRQLNDSTDQAFERATAPRINKEAEQAFDEFVKDREAALKELLNIERAANLSRLDDYQKTIQKMAFEDEDLVAHLAQLRNDGLITEQQFNDARVALAEDAAGRIADVLDRQAKEEERERKRLFEQHEQLVESTAREYESMYDRIVGGARNAGDILNNIWREMAAQAKRNFFDVLARLTVGGGVGAPGSGARSGFGGIIGGILGGAVSAGGGAGAGGISVGGGIATPPFVASGLAASGAGAASGSFAGASAPSSFAAQLSQLESGGLGFGATAVRPAATTASALGLPATTPTGSIFGAAGFSGFAGNALLTAGPLAAIGLGGRIGGPLGGAIGGGLAAASALGGLGLLTGLGIGAAFGPVGLAIVGVAAGVGALIGAINRGKDKRADAAIENAGFDEMKKLLAEYSHYRRDYESTLEGYQQIHQQMQSQFKRKESKRHEQFWYERYVQQLQDIEDERNRRRRFVSSLAVPEFHSGGIVGGEWPTGMKSWGLRSREVPAVLEQGEFVMQRSAVSRLGQRTLEQLNTGAPAGPSSDDGMITVRLARVDFVEAVEKAIPVVLTRGGKASKILRRA